MNIYIKKFTESILKLFIRFLLNIYYIIYSFNYKNLKQAYSIIIIIHINLEEYYEIYEKKC